MLMRLVRVTSAALVVCALVLGAPAPVLAAPDPTGAGARSPGPAEQTQSVGEWSVAPVGPEAWQVEWSSPQALPLTSDRPVITGADGVELATTLTPDGAGVRATLRQVDVPLVEDLDVRLSGRTLDAAAVAAGGQSPVSPKFPVGARLMGEDPAAVGPYPIARSNYALAPVRWPGYQQPIEMVGHMVTPTASAATGPRPLVVFLHGRHIVCRRGTQIAEGWPCRAPAKEIDSHLGYDYLQARLASQGYATASIRVNGINAQDDTEPDGGAAARAMMVARHLDHLSRSAAAQQIDLSRVILVGHSRGGEGVNRAAIQIPLSAPYRVVGQVLLAPTDFAGQSAPYVPTVTVLPSCDGDVSDLQGQQFTDVSRDLLADDTSLKSSVLMVGANHNFFNTEWTPGATTAPADDDQLAPRGEHCSTTDPNRLKAAPQRAAATALVTGAVKLFASGATQYTGLFDGSDVRVASAGTAAMRSHALGGGRSVLRPGEQLIQGRPTLAVVSTCRGTLGEVSARATSCASLADESAPRPHWYDPGMPGPRPRSATHMTWSRAGAEVPWALRSPVDLSASHLSFRMVVDQRFASTGLRVAIIDGAGRSAALTPRDGARLGRLPGGAVGAHWAQTLQVDPTRASGVDLTDIRSMRLEGTTASGGVYLLDAATVPLTAPAVPTTRAALVQVGRIVQREGHGPGVATVRVPVTVTGTITQPARLYLGDPDLRKAVGGAFLSLAPGQRSASVPLTYRPDRRWGGDQDEAVTLMPESGVMTTQYIGGARITEDDPRPRLTLETVATSVREGGVLKLRVRLSAPMATPTYVIADFLRTRRPELRVNDVSRRAIGRLGRQDQLLSRSNGYLEAKIRPGRTTGLLVLPTRRDARREGTEYAKVRAALELGDGRRTRATAMLRVHNR